MITYDEAMRRASEPDAQVRNVAEAAHWLSVARELREASAQPALDRILQQAREAAPVKPSERLAVQDVQADHCPHGVIVVRLPGASDAWWHVADRSWCHPDDKLIRGRGDELCDTTQITDPPNRSRSTPLVSEAATAILTLHDERPCVCGEAILPNPRPGGRARSMAYVHASSGTSMCPKPREGAAYSYAWPAAQA